MRLKRKRLQTFILVYNLNASQNLNQNKNKIKNENKINSKLNYKFKNKRPVLNGIRLQKPETKKNRALYFVLCRMRC